MEVVTPQSEIYSSLLSLGWTLKSIKPKNGVFVAMAQNDTTGQDIERDGRSPEMALAAVYQYAQRANSIRAYAVVKTGAWTSDWLSQKEEIAKAYSELQPFDAKSAPAWQALAAESKVQADAIRQQIKVDISDSAEPYTTAQEMCEDVHKNKHFTVSRANSSHPIWSVEDNINFRIVHDVLGHCQSGGDFSWRGENLACGVHFPLVSPLAREALFTECIGQTAYFSFYHGFGSQKVGFLSQFLHPVQQTEGEHVWIPHGGLPNLTPSPNQNVGGDALDQAAGVMPNISGPGAWSSPPFQQPPAVMQGFQMGSKTVSPNRAVDPNAIWQPQFQAPPVNTDDPAQDYIGLHDTFNNAAKVDTEWQSENDSTQKKAIMNAFRVALLSPRKHLKWNAAHYQAIMHHDPSTPAVELWNTLEEAREQHNQKLGYPEGSHLAYRKELEYLSHELQLDDPKLSPAEALKESKSIIFRKIKEFEAQLASTPENKHKTDLWLYNQARRMVDIWMKENYAPLRGWQPGQLGLDRAAKKEAMTPQLFETDDEWKLMDQTGFASEDAKYGAFMGGHLDAVAEVGKHIDKIRDLAHEDLREGGKGFIFRNGVMNMNLPGVNPKVASFAWLLLAPLTSELGIIDTHVMRGLRRPEESPKVRDYYKMERMQRAAKDATGYGHVPLGMYHWGLWDQIRNPGEHSDHSPLRILDPLPWDSSDAKWDAAASQKSGMWTGPIPFEDARGHMEQAANEFDQEFAGQPSGQVPASQLAPQPEAAYMVP